MRANIEFIATKKGMSAALALVAHGSSDLFADSIARLHAAIDRLRRRAVDAGAIRDDITAEDMLRTLVGLCYTHDKPDWQPTVMRLVDVFLDGLTRPSAKR